MAGRIQVEFAGTKDEAQDYAREHSDLSPGGIRIVVSNRTSPNELPMLSVSCATNAMMDAAQLKLEALGWPREAQIYKSSHKQKYPN